MNWAHVHLLLNHFPVIGAVIAVAALTFAVVRPNPRLTRASFIVLIVVALSAVPVYLTGEPAEEIVEQLPGISEEIIEHHEEAAHVALIGLEALGLLGLAGLLLLRRSGSLPKWFTIAVLALSIIVGGWTFWTANLGGRIRHAEIRPDFRVSGGVPGLAIGAMATWVQGR